MTTLQFPSAVPSLDCTHQGKVRDSFDIPGHAGLILQAASDRVSTHDVVHESLIEGKGYALTALTVFFMTQVLTDVSTHLVAYGKKIYDYLPKDRIYPGDLHFRAVVVRKLNMIPLELVYRSRMAGSLWVKYYSKGLPNPYGIELPPGLQFMSPFERTLFTPTEKSATDDPVNSAKIIAQYGDAYCLALQTFETGRVYAATHGIDIIDGKFEVGLDSDGRVTLGDECLTPDSCRFVRADGIVVGKEPEWLDKQYLRDEAAEMWAGEEKRPLRFSRQARRETERRYGEIVETLTGSTVMELQATMLS